jgi:hypothetical protein
MMASEAAKQLIDLIVEHGDRELTMFDDSDRLFVPLDTLAASYKAVLISAGEAEETLVFSLSLDYDEERVIRYVDGPIIRPGDDPEEAWS